MDTLAQKIKAARKAKNLTQLDLSKILGVTNTTVSNWEQGINKPDIDTIEQLCGILEVSPRYFFTKKAPPAGAGGLKTEVMSILEQLTPEEWADVSQYIEFLLAKRKGEPK